LGAAKAWDRFLVDIGVFEIEVPSSTVVEIAGPAIFRPYLN
jgi:hypothetical protein